MPNYTYLTSSKYPNTQMITTTDTIYTLSPLPLDTKMFTESIAKFDAMPEKSKWNGMLVWVDEPGKKQWHIYNGDTKQLEPFATGGSSGGGGSSSTGVANIVPANRLLIFKHKNSHSETEMEHGDMVEGWISNKKFIKGKYKGGDPSDTESYEVFDEIDFSDEP